MTTLIGYNAIRIWPMAYCYSNTVKLFSKKTIDLLNKLDGSKL